MNIAVLKAELENDPLDRMYAAMDDAEVVASLNAVDRTVSLSRFVTARTMLAGLGPTTTAQILGAIEAASAGNAVLALVLPWLKSPESEGIDIGHEATQEMIAQLGQAGVLTAGQAAAMQAMGKQTVSRAAELGLPVVLQGHVEDARRIG